MCLQVLHEDEFPRRDNRGAGRLDAERKEFSQECNIKHDPTKQGTVQTEESSEEGRGLKGNERIQVFIPVPVIQ
jgi:hypothetical protein